MRRIQLCLIMFLLIFSNTKISAQIFSVASGTNLTILPGTVLSTDSLALTPTSKYSFTDISLRKISAVTNPTTLAYIPEVFKFSKPTNPFGGTIQISYSDNQLNGLIESNLQVANFSGLSWQLFADSINNNVQNYVLTKSFKSTVLNEFILGVCTPPAVPDATDKEICYGCSASLSATGIGTLGWYDSAMGGNLLYSGGSFNTPLLFNTTTYYVQDSTCAVSESRRAVQVTVNQLPTPSFILQPGSNAYTNANVTYTTEADMSDYTWNIPGTINTDYIIVSGGVGLMDNSVTLKWLTTGSKTVTINYSNLMGCAANAPTESTETMIVAAPAPVLTSFTPVSGPIGTIVTITGTNLDLPTSFTIGGISAIVISNDGNKLVAMVMPGAISGNISLTTTYGATTSNINFNIIPTPYPGVQQGSKFLGTGGTGNNFQGYSVSISADGNTAIVGGHSDDCNNGAAWIFSLIDGVWIQQGSKLGRTEFGGNTYQCASVSISADGNTAIVGGYTDNIGVGSAIVYIKSNGEWIQQGSKLVGTGFIATALQGYSVSISADGNTTIVGGQGDNGQIGAAWIFARSNGVWNQMGSKLIGSGESGVASFGASVAISADGKTAVIGGPTDNNTKGAAWIFNQSGGIWTPQSIKLVGNGSIGENYQGISVAISADGNTVIVGGYYDNSSVGAAWIYTRSDGVWMQQGTKLFGSGAVVTANQGVSVSLTADGNTAVIGGYTDNNNHGAIWSFARSNGKWRQQGKKLAGTGAIGRAYQGISVSISADGNKTLVGGFYDNNKVGAAWVFIPCMPPAPPSGSGTTICKGSTASLSATGTGTLGWYDSPVGGNWIKGGGSFTSPPLVSTTTYYVQDSTCTSSLTRTAIVVTVNDQQTTATPNIEAITQPTCLVTTGSIEVGGLPASGEWTLRELTNSTSITGTGTVGTFTWLNPDSYTFSVTNSAGCTSLASNAAVIYSQSQLSQNKNLIVNVFLEGPYDTSLGLMKTTLKENLLLPKSQPYKGSPWYYQGTESVETIPNDVVDWVLVELRQAASAAGAFPATALPGWPRAYFLKSNGSIVDLDGFSWPLIGNPILTNNLYVVIYHRNHISIMSANSLTSDCYNYSWNFTDALSKSHGNSAGYKQIKTGVFGMVSGNADCDGSISVNDFTKWASDFGKIGIYLSSDIDEDGQISVNDFTKWATNFGISNIEPLKSKNLTIMDYWRSSFKSQVP